jgi:hypothetical protein
MGLALAGGELILAHPVLQKLILCIDDDSAILSYEKALRKGLDTLSPLQHPPRRD